MANTIELQQLKKDLKVKEEAKEQLQRGFQQLVGQISLLKDLIKQLESKELTGK